jgi:hypothetical protein
MRVEERMVWVLRLGCYNWGTLIRSGLTAFLGRGIDALFAQVHPDVRKYMLNARRTATTVEQEAQFMSPPVVATTCLSIDHWCKPTPRHRVLTLIPTLS